MVTMQVVFCHLFWEEQIQTWIFWWFVQDEFGFTLISSKNRARYCHGTIHQSILNAWFRLPSSFVKRDMLLLDILIVQDAFKPSGCNFQSLRRPAPKRIRRNFVPGGYSALHLFFEVRHGLKSDFTNDLYSIAYEFFCFRDPFRTMDYPWLFMNKSILSVQVILCIVENLENRILIVVSLVVFTSQKSSTCPRLSFLVYWTDASKPFCTIINWIWRDILISRIWDPQWWLRCRLGKNVLPSTLVRLMCWFIMEFAYNPISKYLFRFLWYWMDAAQFFVYQIVDSMISFHSRRFNLSMLIFDTSMYWLYLEKNCACAELPAIHGTQSLPIASCQSLPVSRAPAYARVRSKCVQ